MRSPLISRFTEAGLVARLLRAPVHSRDRGIFQMDIDRAQRFEYFRLWPGEETQRLDIPGVDSDLRQLILLVEEPRRRFEETLKKRPLMTREHAFEEARLMGGRMIGETATHWRLERWTSGRLRRYLCGMDESHLFIAEFRDGSSVEEAHDSLMPREVQKAQRRPAGRPLRQGEWFFVPLSEQELRRLEQSLRRRGSRVDWKRPLGTGGHPHVADVVARVPRDRNGRWQGGPRVEGFELYARGRVVHPDHRTLHLYGWHRVFRNEEIVEQRFGGNGIFWVD